MSSAGSRQFSLLLASISKERCLYSRLSSAVSNARGVLISTICGAICVLAGFKSISEGKIEKEEEEEDELDAIAIVATSDCEYS